MSTTITSLLNSLHTHLQSQTQLLPTLHAQLGLPPTALTDELATLQHQLTECIESQIDLRRKQVDEWLKRCADIENHCIRYGNALGGHVKTTGGSVGEIRKEQVLPRRFEIASEYQEKLRQLYHTKLEQLLTLTGRLSVLANTLGAEFYPQDILEPTPALGEDEYDSASHRDVTPERFSRLEKELVRGKGELTKRLTQLSSTMVQIDWLHTELGISPPVLEDLPSPSSLTLPPLPRSTSSCSNRTASTSDPFMSTSMSMSIPMSTPTPANRTKQAAPLLLVSILDEPREVPEAEYQRIFARFVARMEEIAEEDLHDSVTAHVGLEGVDPTPGLMAWAESTHAELEDVKRRREAHIQAMYDQLEALWRRLGVPDADMDEFVNAQRGSTDVTVKAYEEELERMLELKRERMGTFVENARAEIIKLWDELMVSEEERADFAPFADDEHTEELLAIHEEEIRRLKEERRLKGPLLASIRKYFDICDDEKELAAAASDQNRLLGRGPRDPGRLLREEKMRKRVSKEKPRLEQDLLASIPAWEAETRRAFLVHGESMVQLLMETVGANDKENTKRSKTPGARAGSVPPRSRTPSNPPHHYMPATTHGGSHSTKVSGVVTPAVRPGSSMATSSHPSKRPRLGESTAAHNNAPAHGGPVYLGSSKGPGAHRPGSPSKIPSKTPSTSIPTSSLPRPVPLAMPVPKPGTVHHALGHGRVPSAQAAHSGYSYQASHSQMRSTSSTSTTSYRTYGAPALNSSVLAKKASRARRESFRPRPSVDNDWAVGGGRWAGFAGAAVKEEDEDY
ncbi:microtubule associated protein-domain-containing protein [Rhodofomes roseus]|uniref:Microtubule associated protein-domain-containing protein n=1 Tax=Rhodofomes roseus TaxID=34475 RepID=A0ABQ8JZR8_9APHY|nr:microtubule associated protein-domain-containing protein [Rhodofomes roseus]KAH9829873.1 microtubule associated protein-domain-containing protein [Rhodofomes roseus]